MFYRGYWQETWQFGAGIALYLCLSGCALGGSSSSQALVKECVLPSDQSGTLSGKWPATPIPIALREGDFDSSEIETIVTAASTWNQFFTTSRGSSTLDYLTTSGAVRLVSTSPGGQGVSCSSGIIQATGTKYSGYVVIYKVANWPKTYPQNAIALTSFCTYPGKPLPTIYMAVMEINYKNFFVSGAKLPDLQSIVLHELGHLHGLNHSCEGTSRTGVPSCNSTSISTDYVTASMYPVFGFDSGGVGEMKRDLGLNDQGRANCLYTPTAASTPTP